MSWPTSRKDKNEGYESQTNHYHSAPKTGKNVQFEEVAMFFSQEGKIKPFFERNFSSGVAEE